MDVVRLYLKEPMMIRDNRAVPGDGGEGTTKLVGVLVGRGEGASYILEALRGSPKRVIEVQSEDVVQVARVSRSRAYAKTTAGQ